MIDVSDSMSPFVDQVRSTVTNLTLHSSSDEFIDVSRLVGLSCLDRLETLSILKVPVISADALEIQNGVFSHLAQSDPPIWPALQRINIGNIAWVFQGDTTLEEELIQFVQTRNPPLAGTPLASKQLPARLREVVVGCCGLPQAPRVQETIDALLRTA